MSQNSATFIFVVCLLLVVIGCFFAIGYIYYGVFIAESKYRSLPVDPMVDLFAGIMALCFYGIIPLLIALWAIYGICQTIKVAWIWNAHQGGRCTKCKKDGVVEVREEKNWVSDYDSWQPSYGFKAYGSPPMELKGMKSVFYCTACNSHLGDV